MTKPQAAPDIAAVPTRLFTALQEILACSRKALRDLAAPVTTALMRRLLEVAGTDPFNHGLVTTSTMLAQVAALFLLRGRAGHRTYGPGPASVVAGPILAAPRLPPEQIHRVFSGWKAESPPEAWHNARPLSPTRRDPKYRLGDGAVVLPNGLLPAKHEELL